MTSLWFLVPAHGRLELSAICFRQLRRTCDTLTEAGVEANAVVIADDGNLDVARELGFWTIEQSNDGLGRKWNDGYQLAAREGVNYVVPSGSDDWIHPDLILHAPLTENAIRCARLCAIVDETGRRLTPIRLNGDGGLGMRITPTALLAPLRYRPAVEDRGRGIDTSTLARLNRAHGGRLQLVYSDAHGFQIVDFKTDRANLNSYASWCIHQDGEERGRPFRELAAHYPAEATADMRSLYKRQAERIAAS